MPATAAQIKEQVYVAVAAAKQERTVRRGVRDTALAGTDRAAQATAQNDCALIDGVLQSLQRAYQRANALEVS